MKKTISICLAFCMMLSITANVFAADDKGLEEAILAVKEVISVPDEYTEFNYNTNQYEDEVFWNLTWTDKNSGSSINAQVNNKNTVLSLNKYSSKGQEGNLSNISKADGEKTAKEFLAKVLPPIANDLRIVNDENTYYYYSNNEFIYTFRHFANDVPVISETATVCINKFSGEVTAYNGFKLFEGEYKAPNGIISKEDAKAKYINNIGIELMYNSFYDYQAKKINIYPVYSPKTNKNEAIDAFTGNVENLTYDNAGRYGVGKGEAGATKAADSNIKNLTPQEEKAVKEVSNLITKEKAAEIIKTYIPDSGEFEIQSANLYKDYYEETKYTWDISFQVKKEEQPKDAKMGSSVMPIYYGAYGRVNAVTGEVLAFNYQNNDDKTDKGISEETAKSEALEFIKKLSPDKANDIKLSDEPAYMRPPYPMASGTSKEEDVKPIEYSYNYVRYANGIPFKNNNITVTYNVKTGRVVSYNVNWIDNISFPSLDKVMSKEAAFDAISKTTEFGLMYREKSKTEKRLVYDFKDKWNMTFDAYTGVQLGYDGKPVAKKVIPSYTDIKGHWCEPIVNKLLENGIYISGDNQFRPDENITQYNFLRYLFSSNYAPEDKDAFYDMLKNSGVVKDGEKAPDSKITRAEAVVFVVRMLGHDKVAKHYEIYNYPFKDSIEDKNKGYVAIAFAFGIIKGDSEGNFNPGNNITNAEASSIIYNVMTNK